MGPVTDTALQSVGAALTGNFRQNQASCFLLFQVFRLS